MPKYGTVNTDLLNLRGGPSTSAPILTKLTKGTVVQVVNDPGFDWLEVVVDGTTQRGYASKVYLTLSDTKPGGTGGTPSAKAEVTATSLNVRSGAGTTFTVLTTVPKGTVFAVLDRQGDWTKVKTASGDGWAFSQYLDFNTTKEITPVGGSSSTGYLAQQADLLNTPLEPAKKIPTPAPNSPDAIVARVWNSYGGLLGKLASMLNCPVNGIVATLSAESGGNCFGPDGRLIIRFENHIFWSRWGKDNPDKFNQFFSFDTSSPANSWKNHMYRTNPNDPLQSLHVRQNNEWEALTIARALDDTAALSSISMGAPQVMGFNFRRLGYDSVQSMFYQFARSAPAQLLAMFDFVRGPNDGNSPAIQALRTGDYLAFANIYNGPANAATYQGIISRYAATFDKLIATAQ